MSSESIDPISEYFTMRKKRNLGYLDYDTGYLYPITYIRFYRGLIVIEAVAVYPQYWECKGTVRILGADKREVFYADIEPQDRVIPDSSSSITIQQTVALSRS